MSILCFSKKKTKIWNPYMFVLSLPPPFTKIGNLKIVSHNLMPSRERLACDDWEQLRQIMVQDSKFGLHHSALINLGRMQLFIPTPIRIMPWNKGPETFLHKKVFQGMIQGTKWLGVPRCSFYTFLCSM